MTLPEEISAAIKRTIRAQNKKRLEELFQDPLYKGMPAPHLSHILEEFSVFFQESDLLTPFLLHPHFEELTPEAIGQFLLAAIRLNNQIVMSSLIYHPQFACVSENLTHQIIQAALEFQNRELMILLKRYLPKFPETYQGHLKEMVACAIRTQDKEWLRHIFSYKHYPAISEQVFADILRWILRIHDRKLIELAIRHQHFNEHVEIILQQQLLEAPLDKRQAIEASILELLVNHPDYAGFSPSMLSWLAEKALDLQANALFNRLATHAQFQQIPANGLGNLFIHALPRKDLDLLDPLVTHFRFKDIPGELLGVILEQSIQSILHPQIHLLFTHHPHFEQIPADSFKRIVLLALQSSKDLLQDASLKLKYEQMIYEAIRRNETTLIDRFLREPILKLEVPKQLAQYATNPSFVNEYFIKDVLRQMVMTMDKPLINQLLATPLFDKKMTELMSQAIEFDEEELIEAFILEESLATHFINILKMHSPDERERLFKIFTSDPQFSQKPQKLREEVLSWKNLST